MSPPYLKKKKKHPLSKNEELVMKPFCCSSDMKLKSWSFDCISNIDYEKIEVIYQLMN